MTSPTPTVPALTLTADKDTYNVGDPIEVTALYSDGSAVQVALVISGSFADQAGNTVTADVTVQVNETVSQPMTGTLTDSFGDTWAEVSNDNAGTAIFQSVVGTPPAA